MRLKVLNCWMVVQCHIVDSLTTNHPCWTGWTLRWSAERLWWTSFFCSAPSTLMHQRTCKSTELRRECPTLWVPQVHGTQSQLSSLQKLCSFNKSAVSTDPKLHRIIKVKFSHTHYWVWDPELILGYRQSAHSWHFKSSPGGRLSLLSTRPVVTFPNKECHHPSIINKLYCLVTEAHRCEQFAQGCYAALPRWESKPTIHWSQVQRSTIKLLYHHQLIRKKKFFLQEILKYLRIKNATLYMCCLFSCF